MHADLEDYYVEEAIKSIRIELDVLRSNPLGDPTHVEGLISWIRFGVNSGKFTLEDVGTCPMELHDLSRILVTH